MSQQTHINRLIIERVNQIPKECITAVLSNFRKLYPQDPATDEQLRPQAIRILLKHQRLAKLN